MASGSITSWHTDVEKVETLADFIFLDSKITSDNDCCHKIKKCFLLGRKAMTSLDSILKSRDITLPTKVCIVKAVFFLSNSYIWMRELDHKEDWEPKNSCFWIVQLEKTLESPLDSKDIKLVSLKGNQLWILSGRTDAKTKLQYFGHLMLENTLMLGKIEGRKRRGQ